MPDESGAGPRSGGVSRRWTLPGALALLALSCAIAFLLGEVTVRLIQPGFPGYQMPQIVHRPSPALGFEMIPDQRGFTFAAPVVINSIGLRGPEIGLDKTPEELRVLCLGDSLTFGVGVGEEIPYPRQLEALLSERAGSLYPGVINAGVQRYSTYQEIDWLRERGVDLEPDVVTLGFYPNDLVVRPSSRSGMQYENERERAFRSLRVRFPWLYLRLKNSALIERVKLGLDEIRHRSRADAIEARSPLLQDAAWTSVADDLETLLAISRLRGFEALVVAIPARSQFTQADPGGPAPRRLLEAADRIGLPHVDLLDPFQASLDRGVDPYLPWDDHLSAAGHRIVAERIVAALDLEAVR